jgi:MSHA biogenesis protein MshQ
VDCSGGACNGVFTSTFNGPFTYTRTVTPAAPFNAAVDMTLSNITDSDGVAYAGNPFKFDNVAFSGADQQRWGRLAIGQDVGDPALPLDVTITAQYYDGTTFVQNPDDDCTAFALATDVGLTNESTTSPQPGDQPMTIGSGTTSITSGNPALVDGLALFSFSMPGAGNSGFVDISVELDVGGADIPWLFYDWDSDGAFDTTTSGRASFGIFSQPEGFIYSREPW